MQVGSREFRQEGLRFQSVRLFSRGELNDEVMRIIRGNIRTESGTMKDIQAMIAVCRAGEAYFHEILGKYGRDTVLDATPRLHGAVRAAHARRAGRASPPGRTARWPTSTTTASPSTSRCASRWRSRWTTGAMTVDFDGLEPAGGGAVQLRRRDHDQRVPAPDQVPDHAARRRSTRAASGPLTVRHPAALGAGLRGAGADRALLRADQPADRPGPARALRGDARAASRPAPTATRCPPSRSAPIPRPGGSSSRAISTRAAPGRGRPTTASRA